MSQTFAAPALAALAVLAALLAGVAGGAVVADDPAGDGAAAIVATANTTNALSPGATAREASLAGDVDVAGAVAVSADRLHGRHDVLHFDRRYEASEQESARIGLVRTAADGVEARLATLDDRQAALYRAFSNGSLSRDAFVRKLARLDSKADRVRNYLEHARTTVAGDFETRLPIFLDTRTVNLRSELVALPTPLSTRLRAAVTGADDPLSVYAQGSPTGLVLSAIEGGQFVRQATLREAYAPAQPNQFDQPGQQPIAVAFQRAADLYPWVFENAIGGPSIRGLGDTASYLVEANHPQGELSTYIHGGSTDVYHEIQRQRPEALPVSGTAANETANLAVTVNATTATGPMHVAVVRPTTETPADAVLAVDTPGFPDRIETGADGEAWLIQPEKPFTLSAAAGGDRVNVTVR